MQYHHEARPKRWKRAVLIPVAIAGGLVGLAVAALFVISGTDWGRERVRRFAETRLNQIAHGDVRIGRISGNLILGATIHNVVVRDSAGQPFIAVESVTGDYSIMSLLRKRVWIRRAVIVHPLVVLDKQPGPKGRWNWDRIFPRDTTHGPPSQQREWTDWITFTDARVVGGRLVVRTPWHPSTRLSPAARDSAVRDALSGHSRLMIQRVPAGYQKIVELDSITANIPLLRLSEPGATYRLGQVSGLRMFAYLFRPPAADVRNVLGTFMFTGDSVWFTSAYGALPNSKIAGDGSYVFDGGDMTLRVRVSPAALADLRWLHPPLPADGRGRMDFYLSWRGATDDYLAYNADVKTGGARIRGSLGISETDSVTVHDTDLRFTGVDTRLLEQVIPGFKSPRRGVASGRAKVNGGRHALKVDGDVTFADQRAGTSRVVALGEVGFLEGGQLRARDLHVDMRPLQVEMLREYATSMPLSGILTGRATLNGSTNTALAIVGDVEHRERGTVSAVRGRASIQLTGAKPFDIDVVAHPLGLATVGRFFPSAQLHGIVTGPIHAVGTMRDFRLDVDIEHRAEGTRSALKGRASIRRSGAEPWFDVDLVAHPLSLVEVGRFFPSAGLRGTATGPIHATGTLHNMRLDFDVALPDSGRLAASGTLAIAGKATAYDLAASAHALNLQAMLAKAPPTSLTAIATARGQGLDPATLRATVAADVSASSVDTIGVDSATVRATVDAGLASIERLDVRAPSTVASVHGAFGLTRARSGELTYRVAIDSIGAYNRFLTRTAADTGAVAPRPARAARERARARADSARIDRATEIERVVTGRAVSRAAAVRNPPSVRRDTIAGSLLASGTVRGNLYQFDLRGRAGGENVAARGNAVRRFQSEYSWQNARTPQSTIAVAVNADNVSALGFQFDTAAIRFAYHKPDGRIELLVRQDAAREYVLKGDFVANVDGQELRIVDMTLRFDTIQWAAPHPALVRWGKAGVEVSNFELRNRENGRVYAHGLLPTNGQARFDLEVDNFPLGSLADLLQTDIDVAGFTTARVEVSGTLAAPTFRGAFGVARGRYNGNRVPTLHGRVGYADRQLVAHVEAVRADRQLAVVDGQAPINLALTGVSGSRLLPGPLSADLVADSLPVELIPEFTDLVSNTHGLVAGKVALRGTFDHPSLTGGFIIDRGTVTINATGATVVNVAGAVRMLHDTIFVDSIAGTAEGPVKLRGALALGNWREPAFDLYLVASGAELLNGDRGRLRVDAGVALTGPFRKAYLSGEATITQGVIRAPEATGRHVIGAGDPALFAVLDTSEAAERELFPARSPMLKNLRMDVNVSVRHNTWVRNREANVEIYTEYPLTIHAERGGDALELTGVVMTDRGDYKFLSKRFQIKRGSALFVGTPALDPTLQITGEYQVQVAARGALNVRVLIGGTLKKPKLSLESDAQPPKTESELLSLLAFGQSATSLAALYGSSIAGSVASDDIVGSGAQLAVNRLAAVALSVAVQEVESEAGKALGVDVLNITPAPVPLFIQGRGLGNFLTQTKIEAGKYINSRTFVTADLASGRLGTGIEQRTADGWQFSAAFEPRLLLLDPTLSNQPFRVVRSYGGLVAKEWRF